MVRYVPLFSEHLTSDPSSLPLSLTVPS
uniref:Uncharacterized protein n=1 Tax=Anguilla anguilla TaxID=7936 RepID=A0A0E9TW29_ANGAN